MKRSKESHFDRSKKIKGGDVDEPNVEDNASNPSADDSPIKMNVKGWDWNKVQF
jgi:hypothetical protein